ncbi:MAG: ParB/RepB/Spo0J family partition protein [Acidobacteriota bacterium]
MTKKALGKGLSALLPVSSSSNEELMELDLDLLEANEEQPRTHFDEQRLDELAESIRANGLVQPILVRRKGGRYQIIAGERRWRAAQRANLHKIPAVVREIPDDKLLELALVENIARQELNPIEEAHAYQRLITTHGLTQEQVARRVGKDRSSVTNILRLLKLPADIQQLVEKEQLSMGHARALLPLEDAEAQRRLASKIINEALSVRDVERLVEQWRSVGLQESERSETLPIDPNIKAAERRLEKQLGTQVRIVLHKNGGRIQIEFHTEEEMQRIYDLLINKET